MELITNPTLSEIKKAAKALKDGHLVAFPTETVYGLGADATNENAVSQVYAVKGRPTDHPLIVHISSMNQISKWATEIPDYAIKLARDFWPGPMTLILKRSDLAKDFVTGGQDNVGLRVPNQPLALTLLAKFELLGGQGVAAPSANRFGAVSPTTSLAVGEELENYLGSEDLILDGGNCHVGIESTIINCTNSIPTILRPGAITLEMVENSIGGKVNANKLDSNIKVSGLFDKHYSPKAKVSLNQSAEPGEGFIALASISTPVGAVRLASPINIEEFARILYEALRNGDRIKLGVIKVILPNREGIANAIYDRILKSSGKQTSVEN
jgi:L-threonylcarbamoyladenylate synthase